MTTPDRPVGGSAGFGVPNTPDEGVVRVFPGAPPATPVAPATHPIPTSAPPSGPPSTGDEAKNAAGDVKDQAASSAADVKDTAASQAGAVKDTAQEQAAQVKDTAVNAASDVAATAREQASNVVGEASQQARQIADSLATQLNEQAGNQQQRAAGNLRTLAEGVSDMAEGRGAPSGPVGDLTRQAADRLQSAAGYLESKQPNELLNDVRAFASRRPGAFLFGAAIAGFAVGRLVKGAGVGPGTSGSSSSGTAGSSGVSPSLPPRPATPPVVPVAPVSEVPVGPDFGTPTPPPGYESRIPVEPIIEEPYPAPNGGLYGQIDPTRPSPGHGDPLADDRDIPGSGFGGRGV